MSAGLPSMKNVLTAFGEKVLLPLGLSGGMQAAAIQKKIYRSETTALIITN